jgi:hypothetical protein
MMSLNAMHKMDEQKRKLVERDTVEAINALIAYIHYDLTLKLKGDLERDVGPVTIFADETDMSEFCSKNGIQQYALLLALEDLARSAIVGGADFPCELTSNGVRRYCRC